MNERDEYDAPEEDDDRDEREEHPDDPPNEVPNTSCEPTIEHVGCVDLYERVEVRGRATFGSHLPTAVWGWVWQTGTEPADPPATAPVADVYGVNGEYRFRRGVPGETLYDAKCPDIENNLKVWAEYEPDGPYGDPVVCSTLTTFNGECCDEEEDDAEYGYSPGDKTRNLVNYYLPLVRPRKWRLYRHLSVSNRSAANVLMKRNGDFLHAATLQIYTQDVHWRHEGTHLSVIYRPDGNGRPAGSRFRFPGWPEHSVILWQEGGIIATIDADRERDANIVNVDPMRPVFISVNDLDRNAGYLDNSGSFDLFVRVLA